MKKDTAVFCDFYVGDIVSPIKGSFFASNKIPLKLGIVADISNVIFIIEDIFYMSGAEVDQKRMVLKCVYACDKTFPHVFYFDSFNTRLIKRKGNKTPNKSLCDYMRLKSELIEKETRGLISDYFTEEDEKDIMGWDFHDAKHVRLVLIKELNGLKINVCPFCILMQEKKYDCAPCSYRKIHGSCDDEKSAFRRFNIILSWLHKSIYDFHKENKQALLESLEMSDL